MDKFDPAQFETKLSPQKEAEFQQWFEDQHRRKTISDEVYRFYKIHGYGEKYDMRAAFDAGKSAKIDPGDGTYHWQDIGKKPNHETFSDESKYASVPGTKPGSWFGDRFIPYGQPKPAYHKFDSYEYNVGDDGTWWKTPKGRTAITVTGETLRTPEGRPVIKNEDGTISTRLSKPTQIGDKWYSVSQIAPNGEELNQQQAAELFVKSGYKDAVTGEKAGPYHSQEEADKAAFKLHSKDEEWIQKHNIEDRFYQPTTAEEAGMSIKSDLSKIMSDSAYSDPFHPAHTKAVQDVQKLSEVLNKATKTEGH
jgi:hypothetical protein